MTEQRRSYAGECVYVGVDVHKETYTVTCVCHQQIVKTATVQAEPAGLAASLLRWFPGATLYSAYEAGFSAFVLHRALTTVGITNIVVNPAMYDAVPYDPYKDFDPVTVAVSAPTVLSVHPSLPVQNVKELVALIKSGNAKYSFASPGVGTPPHLIGESFRLSLGLDLVHVPFNGAGQAVASTLGGHTPIVFSSLPPAVPSIKGGKLRGLAVTSKTRSSALADVPSMVEAGYPQIEGEGWFAFVVPAGTPKDIIALLNREIVKLIALPDINEKIAALGFKAVGMTPDESADLFRREGARWAKVIREAGIKAN